MVDFLIVMAAWFLGSMGVYTYARALDIVHQWRRSKKVEEEKIKDLKKIINKLNSDLFLYKEACGNLNKRLKREAEKKSNLS